MLLSGSGGGAGNFGAVGEGDAVTCVWSSDSVQGVSVGCCLMVGQTLGRRGERIWCHINVNWETFYQYIYVSSLVAEYFVAPQPGRAKYT